MCNGPHITVPAPLPAELLADSGEPVTGLLELIGALAVSVLPGDDEALDDGEAEDEADGDADDELEDDEDGLLDVGLDEDGFEVGDFDGELDEPPEPFMPLGSS